MDKAAVKASDQPMLKLIFFVPEADVEAVKNAVFAAGAGKLGHYDCCSWQVLGSGQFRPLAGADPHIGTVGGLEQVAEYRVEVLCEERCIQEAVAALVQAHPYEEPAWEVVALMMP